MEGLDEMKRELERLVSEGRLPEVFDRLLEALPGKSPRRRTVLSLKGRMKSAEKKRAEGTMSYEKVERALNRVSSALLKLIVSLEPPDLDPNQPVSRISESGKVKRGRILHRIPAQMEHLKVTRCMVRIALDEKTLLEDIRLDEHTKIESLRIAKSMEVELKASSRDKAFSIENINSKEQFIDEDEPTEWQFNVTPLRQGTFPLILKVAITEKVNGKPGKREKVFERRIEIVAGPAKKRTKTAFEPLDLPFYYYSTSTLPDEKDYQASEPPERSLHDILQWKPVYVITVPGLEGRREEPFLMQVEDVFNLQGRGTVVSGRIVQGAVKAGSEVEVVDHTKTKAVTATAIELFRKIMEENEKNDKLRLLLKGAYQNTIRRGMTICSPGYSNTHTRFKAKVFLLSKEEEGKPAAIGGGYRSQFYFHNIDVTGIVLLSDTVSMPGDKVLLYVELISPITLEKGQRFTIRKGGRTVAAGWVTELLD
ncbi:MAG: hypothetical protein J5I94_05075 [Phaeodactylibacter sp.]|nr:hypothetical protein [Phaeodactylibacter sp.]